MRNFKYVTLCLFLASCGSMNTDRITARTGEIASMVHIDLEAPDSSDMEAAREICQKNGVSSGAIEECAVRQAKFAASVI